MAALAVLLATFWPRFRRRASWGPAALAALALVLVPITTSTGESLEHSLPSTPLVEAHTHLADGLLPWVVVLLVGAVVGLWPRLAARRPRLWAFPRCSSSPASCWPRSVRSARWSRSPSSVTALPRQLVPERVTLGILCGWRSVR